MRRLAGIYNLLVNLFWSLLCFVPVCVFCYQWLPSEFLLLFLTLSFIPTFFSRRAMAKLQISKTAVAYKKLGISLIQQISQNGVFVNFLVRRKYSDYSVVRREKRAIEALLNQTYVNEKFHLVGLVFFSLLTSFALLKGFGWWAFFFTVANLFYNTYPILLQQYIWVKLAFYNQQATSSRSVANKPTIHFKIKCAGSV
ncbi:hypothetical protein HRH25_12065 [Flavisolibacter sp. BT320]|nr:hypothetical protein [Flavisolibacter longurius]